MSSYWAIEVVAAANPKSQPSGIPYLTIFGVAGTAVGIAAAIQQFSSSIRRRRFQGAEEALMRAVESSKVISESLSQVEQYQKIKDSLRNEIETQIPKQARIAYLTNRLEQLQDDLRRSYLEYESIRKELSKGREVSGLDRSIRDVIVAAMPARRMQESRSLYMLSLVVLLLVLNALSLGPVDYFRIVGDSIHYAFSSLVAAVIAGALCLTIVWLLLLSFVSNANSAFLWFRRLRYRSQLVLLVCPVLVFVMTVVGGFVFWDHAGYVIFGSFNGQGDYSWVNYAEASFNASVVALSIGIAVPISLWQRRAWQGEVVLRRRKAT